MASGRKKRREETISMRPKLSHAPDEEFSTTNRSHPHPNDAHDNTGKQAARNGTHKRDKKNVRNVDPEELGIQLKRKLAVTDLPSRPGEGTLGKRIKLLSNCFPIKFPSGNVYHYDVTIIQKRRNMEEEKSTSLLPAGAHRDDKKYRCLSTKRNREIVAYLLDNNRVFNGVLAAYDGKKNLYTRREIREDFPIKCEVILPDENGGNLFDPREERRQNVFEVQVKPVKKTASGSCVVSLDSLHALYEGITSSVPGETIMAIETILRHGPCLRFTPIGRSFFSPSPQDLHPLGGGLEIWFGYHQSIRLGQWKPTVNLDITATAFYQKGPLLPFVADCLNTTVRELRRRLLQNTEIKRISNKLKNMRIEVNHLRYRRKYRIARLVKENANRLEFDLVDNGRTVRRTIADYFRERYGRRLECPNLPCLQVYPENKKTYLPLEVCDFVEGQHCKRKLDNRQTAEMIKFTAVPPVDRFKKIEGVVRNADINSDRVVQGFGIEVSREPLHLEGRVLDSPNLWYKDCYKVKPKDGEWSMRDTQFLSGAEIKAWVLLSFANISQHDLESFSELFQNIARQMGISLNNPELLEIINPSRCDIKRVLRDMKIKYKATLAIVVVPVSEKLLYGKIKQAAEISIGLTTQCIKESNVTNPKKRTPQLVRNLCQKINAKMGGENNSLERGVIPFVIFQKPAIVIGADVNHPGPSTGVKPSIAACVGSLDSRLSRFAVSLRAQPNIDEKKQAVEVIVDLKDMVKELLVAFHRHTRKKPEKIIFYRDGVSEGQFEQVRDKELRAIRMACKEMGEEYEPGITLIVVQKRHHVRFRPQDHRDGVGKMLNVPPGTTVDTVVTHPVNFDYYLCSHFGLKGTSRPAHYTVLEDDNDFSADDIQKFTYQLCHTYARCTRSISIPVPVAYADLAAYRARLHLDSALEEATASSDSSDDTSALLTQAVKDAIKVIPELRDRMYFV